MPIRYIIGAIAITFSSSVFAVPIDLFNTDVENTRSLVAGGSIDSHYALSETGTAAELKTSIPGSHAANGSDSQWIWTDSSATPTNAKRALLSGTAERLSYAPEPSIVWLLGSGLVLIGFGRRNI
ncbi:MAG: PEP-CTERM sorting domain-containing protein [Gammaproteobacteria bacterium]|nr:PEP-CTERM sorting domain-containing protein [Gammaproteobacteria bacterium]